MGNNREILIDASAILAVILNEPEKQKIVENTKEKELYSASCLPWEIVNAFSRMLKRKTLDYSEAKAGLATFAMIPWKSIKENLTESLSLCQKYNIFAYDAFYLHAAKSSKLTLLSLDSRMNAVAVAENIKLMEV